VQWRTTARSPRSTDRSLPIGEFVDPTMLGSCPIRWASASMLVSQPLMRLGSAVVDATNLVAGMGRPGASSDQGQVRDDDLSGQTAMGGSALVRALEPATQRNRSRRRGRRRTSIAGVDPARRVRAQRRADSGGCGTGRSATRPDQLATKSWDLCRRQRSGLATANPGVRPVNRCAQACGQFPRVAWPIVTERP
jgi:hypothetical protein